MDVGAELRQAREQRGFSLQDLSQRTKIRVEVLGAIEKNNVERLPGGLYTRGLVKAYAREVGLDAADTSRRYAAQFAPPAQPVNAVERPSVAEVRESHDDTKAEIPYRIERARAAGAIAALALIALSYFALSRWAGSGPSNRPENPRSGAVVRPAGSSVPNVTRIREAAATTGSVEAVPSSAAPSDLVLRVDLQPPQVCWVVATSDGRRVTYRLMLAGERQTIETRSELVLRVGDAARFAFSINGSPGRPLGRAGRPATVRITPGNYKAFLGQ